MAAATALALVVLAGCSSSPSTHSSSRPHVRVGSAAAKPPRSLATSGTSTLTSLPYYGIAGRFLLDLSPTTLGKVLDAYVNIGAKWARFDFSWNAIQAGGPDSYNWTATDAVVSAAQARGIRMLGVLAYTPAWARPSNCTSSEKCAPANPDDFAKFAAAVATRYAPLGVHDWEIWNEPNRDGFWQPQANVTQYTTLLKATYVKIKAADPSATVVTGGLGYPTPLSNLSPYDFLKGIYQNGGKGYFDAVGFHPYCYNGTFDCPNAYASWSLWSQMKDTTQNLVGLMKAYGDGDKKIWGTEFGAPTTGANSVTEDHQASMITDAYRLWKSYSFTGPLFIYTFHDICTDATNIECSFGLVHYDWTPKPSYSAYQASALGS